MATINQKIKFTLFLFGLNYVSQAQSLMIDGKFYDNCKNNIIAEYKIMSGKEIIATGTDRKLKAKLDVEKEYVLQITKDGFVPKTITLNTLTRRPTHYVFLFDVTLQKEDEKGDNTECIKLGI